MKKLLIILAISILSLHDIANAKDENFYQVTLLRAHPGELPNLINKVKSVKTNLKGNMIIMRHSQGDHWDLMLLSRAPDNLAKPHSYQSLVDFQHDFLASSSTDWNKIQSLSAGTGLFHIEMFNAAKGKYQDLLKQREMENHYYHATNRQGNLIFETRFGSDVDIFTIGFYKDMQQFATDPDLPEEVFEKAAIDAGFKSRSDIGFYLRQFLVSHKDTLATQVR